MKNIFGYKGASIYILVSFNTFYKNSDLNKLIIGIDRALEPRRPPISPFSSRSPSSHAESEKIDTASR